MNLNINIDNVKFTDHFSVAEMFRTNANADNSQCSLDELLTSAFSAPQSLSLLGGISASR